MERAFSLVDYLVVFGYLAGIIYLGSRFYERGGTVRTFLLAGRNVAWIPAAISAIAGQFSAISYLGAPAFVVQHDLRMMMFAFTFLLILPVILKVFLPFFSRLNIYTAYEYLEKRFDYRVRGVTSLLFLILRGGYVAIVIYAPSWPSPRWSASPCPRRS